MSSGFSGSFPDFFNSNGGGVNNFAGRSMSMMNVNSNVNRSSYRSPLAGILSDTSSPVVGSRSDFNGKRSLAELQQQQAAIYLRNVRPRAYNQLQMEFLCSPEVSSIPQQLRRNLHGALSNYQINDYSPTITKQASQKQEMDTKMLNCLQELEKELLLDDEEEENDAVSVVTDTAEWSETIQRLLNPENNTVSPSPTTSSTSSSASSSASVSPKQFVSDAAEAITDGKTEIAAELITHIDKHFNARGSPEQRLGFYMASALRSRVSVNSTPSPGTELYRKEHILSTQLLYDKSPCFKIAFIAANNLILQALLGNSEIAERKIHVVDFDIGHGFQYVSLLHEIAAARKSFGGINIPISLKLTTFKDFGNGGSERLRLVGDELKSLANKLGVLFYYNVLDFKLSDLNRQGLAIGNDDVLAVNFAFKLSKFPDESVTTENLRDEVLRRVKGLSPGVVTVVEQELNANTASFTARVNDLFSYYTSFLNSLEATIPRGDIERVKIEEGLSRRIFNSVACEGRDRVERCEVFGKWRARLRMAGFESKPVSQLTVESLMSKMNSWTRGNVGFTVKEESGGISFGWMGRTLTVVSAWH